MHKKGDRGRGEEAWSLDDVVYKTEGTTILLILLL